MSVKPAPEGDQNLRTSFREVMSDLMHRKRLTQAQLAFKCDISQSYLSRIEKGERSLSEKLSEKLAGPLGIKSDILLTVFQELKNGSNNSHEFFMERLLGRGKAEEFLGTRVRQLREDDILEIFGTNKTGVYEFRGRTEDTEISNFSADFLQVSSYDTRAHGIVTISSSGDRDLVEADDKIEILPRSNVLIKVFEEITFPSWLEAELAPASNIAMKGLHVAHGPIIDPYFSGPLVVSVFNPSDEPKFISRKESFMTLRFWIAEI